MDSRDEFIREITLRSCSSLDIKESLRSAFEYMREKEGTLASKLNFSDA